MFDGLPKRHFGAMLVDPPWKFIKWSEKGLGNRAVERHYDTIASADLASMPVGELAADDCVLFLWICWPYLMQVERIIQAWGFEYKTCAFDWMKARADQLEMFRDDLDAQLGLGFWTRSNTEPCLLATRGHPQRLHADVRMGIIEPRREHSRKPDCVHDRIERLVAGPYLELFARQERPGWSCWGDQVRKFNGTRRPSEDDWHDPFFRELREAPP